MTWYYNLQFSDPDDDEITPPNCEVCHSENVNDGIDWFDEGKQITRTQYKCLDCGWVWDEPTEEETQP